MKTRRALVDVITDRNSSGDDLEKRLVKHLFDGYNKEVRPVRRKEDAVQVVFGMAYTQLLDLVG